MRALITGGYGFVGRHLAQHLVSCGDDVAVSYHPNSKVDGEPKSEAYSTPLPKIVQSVALDVSDADGVRQLISVLRPDAVYHLAAQTFVPDFERDYRSGFEVNSFGTLNLLDAIVEHSPETRFLCVSSSEAYGEPRPGGLPLTEDSPLRPISFYGVSKAMADVATFRYSFREGVQAVRVRPFSHVGPGQDDRFALSSFAKQIAKIKLGRAEPVISVGNLEVKRDFSDVSDIVRGYREALLNGKRGAAYNLCSGNSHFIQELLEKLIGIAEVDVEIKQDPNRMRPADISDVYGTYSRAQKDFGWKPRIEIEATLNSLFTHWLEVVEKSRS